jgi:hypothetical protein
MAKNKKHPNAGKKSPPRPRKPSGPDVLVSMPTTIDGMFIMDRFPEEARLIGCIVGEWTQIEHRLVMLLSLTANDPRDPFRPMLYSITGSLARLHAIQAGLIALMLGNPEHEQTCRELAAEAERLLEKRNKIAHALFGFTEQGNHFAIVKPGSQVRTQAVSFAHLNETYERMKKFSCRLGVVYSAGQEFRRQRREGARGAAAPPKSPSDSALGPTRPPPPTRPKSSEE